MGIEKMGDDAAIKAAKAAVKATKEEVARAAEALGKAGQRLGEDLERVAERVVKDVETIASGTKKLFKRGVKDVGGGIEKTLDSTPINVAAGLGEVGLGVVVTPFSGSKQLSKKLADMGIANLEKAFTVESMAKTVVGPVQATAGVVEVTISGFPALVALPAGAFEAAGLGTVVTLANTPEIAGRMAILIGKEIKLGAKELVVLEKELEWMLRNVVKEAKKETISIAEAISNLVKKYPFYTTVGATAALVYAIKKARD